MVLRTRGDSQLRGLDRMIEAARTEYGGAKVRRVGDVVFAGAIGASRLDLLARTMHVCVLDDAGMVVSTPRTPCLPSA